MREQWRDYPYPADQIREMVCSGIPINSSPLAASVYRLARSIDQPHINPDGGEITGSQRVALVIPYHPLYEIGGLEIGTRKLAEGLASLGHSVEIISKGQYADRDLTGIQQTPEGITVQGIGKGIEEIISYLFQRVSNFDVIQWMEIFPPIPEEPRVYNDKAEQQYLASVVLRALGINTFMYVATSGNVTSRGTDNINWNKVKKHQPFNTLLPKAIVGLNVINPDIISEYEEVGISISKDRFEVIPLGVDTQHFFPISSETQKQIREELGLPLDKTVLFYIGRFVERKRPDLLVRLWSLIPEEITNEACLIFIGGKAAEGQPDSIYGETKELIKKFNQQRQEQGLTSNIINFDLIPHEQMAKFIQAGDILIFPSRREGLGMVLLEAMACGKPVFASDIPGVREAIPNSEVGIRFNPEDEEEIKKLMIQFITSPEEFSHLGIQARRYVEENWSWQVIAKKLSRFYLRFSR